MENKRNYVQILVESLQKKVHLLDQIMEKSQEQHGILRVEPMDMDAFEKCTIEKTTYIEELDNVDIGFEILYERIKEVLKTHKADYAKEILQLQGLIAIITDKSVAIQAMELRNKEAIEAYFSYTRKRLKASKNSTMAANNYYKNMNRINRIDPQILDTKK